MRPAGPTWPVQLAHGPILLRPLRRRDAPAWSEIRARGADWFAPWDSTQPPGALDRPLSFYGMVADFHARARAGLMLPFAVAYQPEPGVRPVFAGQVTVSGITRGSASWAQLGYWVDPRWAGRRIIPTAVAMAADHCFGALRLHRLEIAIRPENHNSLRVVAKLGFRYEGRRQRYMHVAGDWRDHDVFVLTAEEVPQGVLARWESSRDKG